MPAQPRPKPPATPARALARVAVAVGLAASLPSSAQTPPAGDGIRLQHPAAGTLIRLDAVRSTAVPIDLRYEQLSEKDRATVHGWYEHMAHGDEPPFPVNGLKDIVEAVRKAQATLRVRGELLLVATVEPGGEVSAVTTLGAPSPAMNKLATRALALTDFKPAVCGGQKCRMDFPLHHLFKVD